MAKIVDLDKVKAGFTRTEDGSIPGEMVCLSGDIGGDTDSACGIDFGCCGTDAECGIDFGCTQDDAQCTIDVGCRSRAV